MATATAHKRHLVLRSACIDFLKVDPSNDEYELYVVQLVTSARRLLHAVSEEKT
jgi:hypothetical protein